jgi:hypothetical protein
MFSPMDSTGTDVPFFGGTDLTIPATQIRPVHGRPGTEPPRRVRLGEALVASGVITPEQLTRCLAEQAEQSPSARQRLGEIITARRLASEVDIALGLSSLTGFAYVDFAGLLLDPEAIRRLPRPVCERYTVLPLGVGDRWLRLAMADPTDRLALDHVRDLTGVVTISVAISTGTAIRDALQRAWSVPEEELARQLAARRPNASATGQDDDGEDAETTHVSVTTSPEPPVRAVGDPWDYLFVGDGMPMDHPGYVRDATELDLRLADLGALGWEAVGIHANGARVRVLLKRRRA